MIILDTNVLSELMRSIIAPPVERWATRQIIDELYTTAIAQAEILAGLETMPSGKKRDLLAKSAKILFDIRLSGRILAFEAASARAYAGIVADRRRMGRPITAFDAQIAAIARTAGASVATRNVKDFEGCGIPIVDPWAE